MPNELAIRSQTGVLSRVGTPDERQYLIQIMAEQIGIPAKDASRTDVLALLGAAVQRTIQYGWMPGIHLHVQKFETERSRQARRDNPSLVPIYTYTLVDGEKAWKDSGTRWRDRGVQWHYQRKPMAKEEVREEARLQGYNEALAANAYGMWSRIIIVGQDNPSNDNDPLWSAGIYSGKVKAGKYWRDDVIPSGISSRDIAIRRADKRAMMQSQLTLLPVDDLGTDARIQQLVENLRHEVSSRARVEAPLQVQQRVQVEEDGDVLWAIEDTSSARIESRGARPDDRDARPVEVMEILDIDGEIVAEPSEDDDAPLNSGARIDDVAARPAPHAARPLNTSDGPCPECHAPVGKAHATSCKATAADGAARPAEVAARPEATSPDARIGDGVARPETQAPMDFEGELYAELARVYTPSAIFSNDIKDMIRKARNADKDSSEPMSATYFKALMVMVTEVCSTDPEDEVYYVLTAMLGYRVGPNKRPGQLVHSHFIKPLRDRDAAFIKTFTKFLMMIRDLVLARMGEKNG